MKSRNEVESLKADWKHDPCWDIEDTDGFEEHHAELLEYRLKCERQWDEEYKAKEAMLDLEANTLGLEGLYRIILKQQKKIDELEQQLQGIK